MPSNQVLTQAATSFLLLVGLQLLLARVSLSRESRRNVQHWTTGQAFLLVSYVLPLHICITMLSASSVLFYYLETYQRGTFIKYFGPFLRPSELVGSQHSGAFFFLLGTAVTAQLVPLHTARFALQCLATVDPMAGFVGRNVSSRRINPSTTLAGSVAGFVTACAIGYYYMGQQHVSVPWFKILVGAVTCCIVEASPYGNDNFMIPVVTGLAVEAAGLLQRWV